MNCFQSTQRLLLPRLLLPLLLVCTPLSLGCNSETLDHEVRARTPSCQPAERAAVRNPEPNRGFELEICDVSGTVVRKITDRRTGSVVELAEPPQRIVSQSLGSDEVLFALLDGPDFTRLVAVSALSTSPDYSDQTEIAARVGQFVTDKTEEILALTPDLVLAASYSTRETLRQLELAGVPTLVLHSFTGIDDAVRNLETIAFALFLDARGRQLIERLRGQVAAAQDHLAAVLEGRDLRVLAFGSGSVYSLGTTFNDLAERLALTNIPAAAGLKGWPIAHGEQLLAWQPDLIYIAAPLGSETRSTEVFRRKFPALFAAATPPLVVALPQKQFTTVSQHLGHLAIVMAERTAAALDS